jgi:hypothetical protein
MLRALFYAMSDAVTSVQTDVTGWALWEAIKILRNSVFNFIPESHQYLDCSVS